MEQEMEWKMEEFLQLLSLLLTGSTYNCGYALDLIFCRLFKNTHAITSLYRYFRFRCKQKFFLNLILTPKVLTKSIKMLSLTLKWINFRSLPG